MAIASQRKPIMYVDDVDIRFADLDYYGHVNSKHYLDLVSTTRLTFFAGHLKTSIEDISARGIGFFLMKSTISYRQPIIGLQTVRVRSHVAEIRGSRVLMIPFEIMSRDEKVLHSDGILEFAIVDTKTQKVKTVPEWLMDLFYVPSDA